MAAGVAAAAGSVLLVAATAGVFDRSTNDGGDTERFVDAWEQSRRGTFVMSAEFVRTTADGRELRSTVEWAQRPPDRLIVQFGSASGQLDGRPVGCTTDGGGFYRCGQGEPGAADFDEALAAELAVLRTYVEGDAPLYRVSGDSQVIEDRACFDLELDRPIVSPPYGERARFCFDAETGAPVFLRVERLEATDVTEATAVRAEVSDDDLVPPETAAE